MFDFPSPNAVLEAENNCYFKVTQTSKTLGLRIGTPTANRKDPTGGWAYGTPKYEYTAVLDVSGNIFS